MLEVQKYLLSGKTLEDLSNDFGIKIAHHPHGLPLLILNYDQIESQPKTHPIIRECRALVLNKSDWSIAARSFVRFFNWGEVQDEQDSFDFSDFIVQSKEDGSLVLLYYFNGEWHANTRGSFAVDLMEFQEFTWRQGICKALSISDLSELNGVLDQTVTYICEFCSPWNKVVRKYDKPQMYLLGAFRGIEELTPEEVDALSEGKFKRPDRYKFSSIEEIQNFLREQSVQDATFEGVVIRDKNGNRWKIKNATYLSLHKMKGESGNLFNPKYLLPFVIAGEQDELLTYFPEVKEKFLELKSEYQGLYIDCLENWITYRDIKDQKEFALKVKDRPFASILFSARSKFKDNQTVDNFRQVWKDSENQILRMIKTPS